MKEIAGLTFTGHSVPKEKRPSAATADFSETLRKTTESQGNQLRERIGKSGLAGYAHEQQAIAKLTNSLALIRSESQQDVREQIDLLLDGFKAHPPSTRAAMEHAIQEHIKALPDDAPANLKSRMQAVFVKARQISALGEEEPEAARPEDPSGTA